MKFLCDSMLHRLGRWLRAAGYDTALANHRDGDRELIAQAAADGRLLLSCDRKLLEVKRAAGRVLLLPSNDLEGAVARLSNELKVDWLHRPFSRCLDDNAELEPAPPERHHELPAQVRALDCPIVTCPRCGKLYWPGSHYRRMRARLEAWRRRSAP